MLGKIFPAVLCGLIPIEHRAGLCVLHYGGHQIGHMGKFGLGLLNVPGQRVKTLCGGIGLCSQIVIFKELVLFQILQRSRHLFKVIHLGPAFIGRAFKVECYPNTPAIKVQLLPVNAGERITMTQNLGQPLPRYQAFLCDGMLEVDSTAFMDYMEKNDLGYIVDYKRYDADVFTGVNRRTAAVFQFHSAALRRLNKVGCQRYEGDYTRLKQKHAERRARRMAG